MQTGKLMTGMISSWTISVVYDRIRVMTGMEPKILLVAALLTMAGGLYFGLYAKSNETTREEA